MIAGVLFDIWKAFDTVDRQKLQGALHSIAVSLDLELVLIQAHRGCTYAIRDPKAKKVLRKVTTVRGVRQGSVKAHSVL